MLDLLIGGICGFFGLASFLSDYKSPETILKKLLKNIDDILERKVDITEEFVNKFTKEYLENKLKGRNEKVDRFYLLSSEGYEILKKKIDENICGFSEYLEKIKEVHLKLDLGEMKLLEYQKNLKVYLEKIDLNILSKNSNKILEKENREIKKRILNIDVVFKIKKLKERANKILNKKLFSKEKYYSFYEEEEIQKKIERLLSEYKVITLIDQELEVKIKKIKDLRSKLKNKRENHNKNFIEKEKKRLENFFVIDNYKLDSQQIEAVLKNEISSLVIAGAGTGKTTTIRGKVKYLIDELDVDINDILVLAFNNSASSNLKKALSKDGYNIESKTFHSLGKSLLPKEKEVLKDSRKEIAKLYEEFAEANSEYMKKISEFFLYFLNDLKSEFDFESVEDYILYLKNLEYKSLKNEYHRSYEEVLIANFLFKNNINYEYEKNYEIPEEYKNEYSKKNKSLKYRPDFYLPDYNIYIEHFGIDEKGNVPKHWKSNTGVSAKEEYLNSMKWKIKLHEDLNTKLIKTYSYEFDINKTIYNNLKNNLIEQGVVFKELSNKEIIEKIKENLPKEYNSFIELLTNFIIYAKENNINLKEVFQNNNFKECTRNSLFLEIAILLSDKYENNLIENNKIDFSDMIVKATEVLQKNKKSLNYKYILVDEFQDVSLTKFNFIKEIWEKNKGFLFCVGDDWQSIYGFLGSDISIFLNLEKYTKCCEVTKIETTYRYPKTIAELAGHFIMKNKYQIKKDIKTMDDNSLEKKYNFIYYKNKIEMSLEIKKIIKKLPKDSKVLILGRYKDDINLIKGTFKVAKDFELIFSDRRDLDIKFKTVHSAKGSEADYVFIINNTNQIKGFPSLIEDDSVFKLIKKLNSKYPFDEERRLFYVALTRCKKKVYLFVDILKKSSFIRELEKDFSKSLKCPYCNDNLLFDDFTGEIFCEKCKNKIDFSKIYIDKNCSCNSPYSIKYSKKTNHFFLSCSDYPNCKGNENFNYKKFKTFL